MPIELPIAPEIVVFDQPETLRAEPALRAESGAGEREGVQARCTVVDDGQGLARSGLDARCNGLGGDGGAPTTVMPAAPLLTVIVWAAAPTV